MICNTCDGDSVIRSCISYYVFVFRIHIYITYVYLVKNRIHILQLLIEFISNIKHKKWNKEDIYRK